VEASALDARRTRPAAGLPGRSPLLRLQSDERLIALVRKGHHGAFETLVKRYHARLLAFCRHMLGSREDAEDVLQEVFAAAFNAILADERPINARPWLYRIARNRSLNHLRRAQPIGVDSMDIHFAEHGATTADKVDRRETLRELVADVQQLPETQRTALLLREIDALSYEQIAEAMETTIPSVKSLLVRARVSLAEAAEARRLSCDEVRYELGEVAEGLRRRTSPPVRRHLRACERCTTFHTELRASSKALALLLPVGPLLLAKKLLLTHVGLSAGAGSAGAGGTAAGGAAAGAATSGGLLSAGVGTIASKAAVGLAAAAAVTAGAVEIERHVPRQAAPPEAHAPAIVAQAPPTTPATSAPARAERRDAASARAKEDRPRKPAPAEREPKPADAVVTETVAIAPAPVVEPGHTQVESSATSLPVSLPAPAPTTAPSPGDVPAAAPGGAVAPPPEPAPAIEVPPVDVPPVEVPPVDVPPADLPPAGDPPPTELPAQP
jgi:RNA polymerase sigma factor (sigma-70 family)